MTALETAIATELADKVMQLAEQIAKEKQEQEKATKPLMTKNEVAKWLGVAPITVTNWISQGLPFVEFEERATPLFLAHQVIEFLEEKSTK